MADHIADDGSPHLALGDFHGPLALLLELARRHRVELERIPLLDLIEQLTVCLLGPAPLFRKADWLVMTAWLLQLRAGLPTTLDGGRASGPLASATFLRERLLTLRDVQALADWLDRRPALGRDVFARARPEPVGPVLAATPEPDIIEFLWASLALFDADLPPADSAVRPHLPMPTLHTMADALSRLRRLLAASPEGWPLGRLVPPGASEDPPVRRRSAWSSGFVACLELARQGEAGLMQDGAFGPIHVHPVRRH